MSAIPNKPNKGLLSHLDAQDRWEAEDMLIGLGMKYYGLISHTRVVDMYTLKQIYGKSLCSATALHTQQIPSLRGMLCELLQTPTTWTTSKPI